MLKFGLSGISNQKKGSDEKKDRLVFTISLLVFLSGEVSGMFRRLK